MNKGWANNDDSNTSIVPIPDVEKAAVRARLVPVLASAHANSRPQLIVALQKILHSDFPSKWPDFVDITIKLLSAQDVSSVFAGLQCLLAICRTYRFKLGENREDFDKIVAAEFPQLLNIGNSLLNETSLEAPRTQSEALRSCWPLEELDDGISRQSGSRAIFRARLRVCHVDKSNEGADTSQNMIASRKSSFIDPAKWCQD